MHNNVYKTVILISLPKLHSLCFIPTQSLSCNISHHFKSHALQDKYEYVNLYLYNTETVCTKSRHQQNINKDSWTCSMFF